MKIYIFTLITILWTLPIYCQENKLVIKKFTDSKQINESYYVLKSDGKTKHGEYISYFRITENDYKQIKNGQLELDYFIKIKGSYNNGKKDGEWIEYSQPNLIKTKGNYDNGKKIGIWLTLKEQGQVYERFDYDNNKKISPLIQINASYPQEAQEAELQGKVIISYKIHNDCTVTDITIKQSLSKDCDNEAIEAIKKFGELLKKYGVDCDEKIEIQSLLFKLSK